MSNPKSILITGASGLIGKRLTAVLQSQGHRVSHLTRGRKANGVPSFQWDIPHRIIDREAVNDIDIIVHLAGAGVAEKRWTRARKNEILASRTESARLLLDTLKGQKHRAHAFISASGIGYYGYPGQDRVTESSPPGDDFLALVTGQWEDGADRFAGMGMRVVKLRLGMVLSPAGGALKKLATPVRFGVGAPLGTGKQVVSWIHIDDVCGIFLKAIEDGSMRGVFNAVAPFPVTNAEMTKAIGRALHRPVIIPCIPGFALKVALGEMAGMVLNGSNVSAQKIMDAGYRFRFPNLDDALRNLLSDQ